MKEEKLEGKALSNDENLEMKTSKVPMGAMIYMLLIPSILVTVLMLRKLNAIKLRDAA